MGFVSKNWQLLLLAFFLIVAVVAVFANFSGHNYDNYIPGTNVKLGLDFSGGTFYQVELQKPVTSDEMTRIVSILQKRVDPSGLKDATVTPVGGQFIVVQLPETDPVELEKVESRMRQQGMFEATLDGNIIFTGDEIQKILRDTSYGVGNAGSAYEWSLPFVLNDTAAKRFAQMTFHKCSASSFSATGQPVYDCEKTYFFLDKPDALLVTTPETYAADEELLNTGNQFAGIPQGTKIDEIILNSQLTVFTYDQNTGWDENVLSSALKKTNIALVSPDLSEKAKLDLNAFGFNVSVAQAQENTPWIWSTTNVKQVISLTAEITNEDVPENQPDKAQVFSTLRISGTRATYDVAKKDLEELTILLESGSLPTPIKSISKETISPSLGQSFLSNIFIMGILAIITVAMVIIIRYRMMKLVVPILLTGMAEILIMFGLLAAISRPVDLAAFAGLIAAIGTGVDSEIVITDEIIGRAKGATESLLQRAKAALFIIMTSAFTMIGVMGPILLFSRNLPGLDKLYGFAVVAIAGALAGVFITRPAFTKIVEKLVTSRERHEAAHAHEHKQEAQKHDSHHKEHKPEHHKAPEPEHHHEEQKHHQEQNKESSEKHAEQENKTDPKETQEVYEQSTENKE